MQWKNFHNLFSHFDIMQECFRQRDGRTYGQNCYTNMLFISLYVYNLKQISYSIAQMHQLKMKQPNRLAMSLTTRKLTNPRDAKACQKLLQFDVLTTLSLTILAYLHAFRCCCVRNLRNPEKFTENSNLWSSRSSKVINLGANRKPICDFISVINSNFSRICDRFRDIHG